MVIATVLFLSEVTGQRKFSMAFSSLAARRNKTQSLDIYSPPCLLSPPSPLDTLSHPSPFEPTKVTHIPKATEGMATTALKGARKIGGEEVQRAV